MTSSFSYNKRLQPLTMSASTPGQTVFSIGYDFHAGNGTAGSGTDNGNVWGIYNYRDRNRDQSFSYDALNRLLSAQNAGTDCSAATINGKTEYWGNSYSYDAWGNLLGKAITKCGAENFSVTADAHNWIHAAAPDYQYDAAGNMTFDATSSLNYSFDQENRITGAAGYTYTYDGDGNRVRKSNGNLAANGTLYWYMTPGVVAESDLAGTLKSEYVFFGGERVARKDFPGNTVAYYLSDHLKTASVITDASGTIKAESDYYPWGGELQFVNNDSNDYKFTGKKRDSETGLDYFGARYYSNGLGRWISADWSATPVPVPYADFADPQTLNLYQFVGGNPASKADPDGHDPLLAFKLVKWFAGAAQRDGGVKPALGNTGIGVTKGLGSLAFGTALSVGPGVLLQPFVKEGPALQPSNQTQADAKFATQGIATVTGAVFTVDGMIGSRPSTSVGERLPQDVSVNPRAPAANNGNGTVGPSATQNAAAQADATAARAAGHTDIRMTSSRLTRKVKESASIGQISNPPMQMACGITLNTIVVRKMPQLTTHAHRPMILMV